MRIRQSFKRRLKRLLPVATITLATLVLVGFIIMLSRQDFYVLDAMGTIGKQQRDLLLFATILSLIVVVPVFALTIFIVRKYRVRPDGSSRAKQSDYAPDLEGNTKLETLWWAIPSAIILVLSVVTWQTSHSLDPYKPLASKQDQMTIEVVAMQWKWLFIYPEENIATVNYFKMPVGKPVQFKITSDAPMNSFWIPQLGGQVYAMSGMTSQLHLRADHAGDYRGVSANISGEGFADMVFKAQAVSDKDYREWVAKTKAGDDVLTRSSYDTLARPGIEKQPRDYASVESGLYQRTVDRYMHHGDMDKQDGSPVPMMDQMEGMDHAH